jgi:hypothetical protein
MAAAFANEAAGGRPLRLKRRRSWLRPRWWSGRAARLAGQLLFWPALLKGGLVAGAAATALLQHLT